MYIYVHLRVSLAHQTLKQFGRDDGRIRQAHQCHAALSWSGGVGALAVNGHIQQKSLRLISVLHEADLSRQRRLTGLHCALCARTTHGFLPHVITPGGHIVRNGFDEFHDKKILGHATGLYTKSRGIIGTHRLGIAGQLVALNPLNEANSPNTRKLFVQIAGLHIGPELGSIDIVGGSIGASQTFESVLRQSQAPLDFPLNTSGLLLELSLSHGIEYTTLPQHATGSQCQADYQRRKRNSQSSVPGWLSASADHDLQCLGKQAHQIIRRFHAGGPWRSQALATLFQDSRGAVGPT